MRIALVILHADRALGGAETYTLDLAAALVRRGYDVSLLATTFGAPNPGVTEVPLDAEAAMRSGRYLAFLDALDEHLTQTTYDVVHAMLPVRHCDVYHPHAGIAAAEVRRWTTVFNPRRRAMARVERELLLSDDGPVVVCLSDYVKGFVRKYLPLPEERLVRLFNAVDLERFTPGGAGRMDGVNALIIAQDFERKGLRQAIEALARTGEARLHLTVVGKGDPSPYVALAEHAGVTDRVTFAGPTTDPASCYRSADFFVLPTRHDPCSLVVLEALSMGLPVISTIFNGATEVMTDGRHGFILPDPADVGALADRMNRLVDDPTRHRMAAACLELRPTLSYEHHLNQLETIYQSKRPPTP